MNAMDAVKEMQVFSERMDSDCKNERDAVDEALLWATSVVLPPVSNMVALERELRVNILHKNGGFVSQDTAMSLFSTAWILANNGGVLEIVKVYAMLSRTAVLAYQDGVDDNIVHGVKV